MSLVQILKARTARLRQSDAALWARWQAVRAIHRLNVPLDFNSADFYDDHFTAEGGRLTNRARLALQRIPAGASVLEVGCGRGTVLAHLQAQGHRVLGLELSPKAVQTAQDAGVPAQVHDLLGGAPLPTGYDVVLCMEVLEHFAEPWAIYDQLWAAAGQRVVVTVPDRFKVPSVHHLYEFTNRHIAETLAPRGPVTFVGGHPRYIVFSQDKPA